MTGLVRTITHWTGGGGRVSSDDLRAYHFITEFDGRIVKGNETPEDNVVTSDGDYAPHVHNLNTGSIGCAMAGMKDATEYPLNFGPSPLNRNQFEAHCKHLAEVHRTYGIPVTPTTCLTHAEVEPVLGVKQNNKWDIVVLEFEPTIRGAIPVGNYMRKRVEAYMGESVHRVPQSYPMLSNGQKGAMVKEAQGLLRNLGYFLGKVDGIFGTRTRDAVMSFQADHGLEVDGVVGRNTWAALMRGGLRPQREVTEKDLKNEGSRTIREANKIENIATVGGTLAVGTSIVDMVSGATGALQSAESGLEVLQRVLLAYWPSLAVLAAAVVIYLAIRGIKKARVEDARSGRNLGR